MLKIIEVVGSIASIVIVVGNLLTEPSSLWHFNKLLVAAAFLFIAVLTIRRSWLKYKAKKEQQAAKKNN